MMEIILYTKEGCTLCDKLKIQLEAYQNQYPHQLREVDITQDDALFEKYRFIIPVLKVGEIEFNAPIDERKLETLLDSFSKSSI